MIDFQPQMVFAVRSIDAVLLRNNAAMIAKAAAAFKVSTVLTSVSENVDGRDLVVCRRTVELLMLTNDRPDWRPNPGPSAHHTTGGALPGHAWAERGSIVGPPWVESAFGWIDDAFRSRSDGGSVAVGRGT